VACGGVLFFALTAAFDGAMIWNVVRRPWQPGQASGFMPI
jgi:hypothetical protein